MWPAIIPAQSMDVFPECLAAFKDAAVTAARTAASTHLHASVTALLRGDRSDSASGTVPSAQPRQANGHEADESFRNDETLSDVSMVGAAGAKAGGLPPPGAAMDEQLQWLRPSAFAALLESMLVVLRTLQWFHSGCEALLHAAMLSIQVQPELAQACNTYSTQADSI